MDKEQALDLHMETWNQMAEELNFDKHQMPCVAKHKPLFGCFLCDFFKQSKSENLCNGCPMADNKSGYRTGCANYDDQPYVKFFMVNDMRFEDPVEKLMALKQIAIEIADKVIPDGY